MKTLAGLALVVVAIVLLVKYQTAWAFIPFIVGGYMIAGKGKRSPSVASESWSDRGSDDGGSD